MATPNSVKPETLIAEITELVGAISKNTVEVCQKFALAWLQYETGAWSNAQFSKFARELFKAGCSPNPKSLLMVGEETGKYSLQRNVTWLYMVTVGESEIFKDETIVSLLRATSYRTLYEINGYAKQAEKLKLDPRSEVLKLLRATIPVEADDGSGEIYLTRKFVSEAKQNLSKKLSSQPPRSSAQLELKKQNQRKLAELVEEQFEADNLLITPNEEFFDMVDSTSARDFAQQPFRKLVKPDTKISLVANAGRLSSAIQLFKHMGKENPHLYCLTSSTPTNRLFPLTEATVLLTSKKLSNSNLAEADGTATEIAQSLFSEPNKANLHLFGEEAVGNWVVCSGSD